MEGERHTPEHERLQDMYFAVLDGHRLFKDNILDKARDDVDAMDEEHVVKAIEEVHKYMGAYSRCEEVMRYMTITFPNMAHGDNIKQWRVTMLEEAPGKRP